MWRELSDAALDAGDKPFIRTTDARLTYSQVHRSAIDVAQALAARDVRPGDAVALLMRNSADQVVLWFALNAMGVVHAPLNTAMKGAQLEHAIRLSDPVLVVADRDLLEMHGQVLQGRGTTLHDLLVAHGPTSATSAESLELPGGPAGQGLDPLATATLLFTSGTTGRSKACMLSNTYLVRQGQLHCKYLGITSDDVLYTPFPLFHIDAATLTVSAALSQRATAALGQRFSASGFWEELRRFDATVFNFMGATLTILWKQPTSPGDLDHRVRLAWGVPLPDWHTDFTARFGIPLREVYGLTDAGVPVYDRTEVSRPGKVGKVIDEYELRIVPAQNAAERNGDRSTPSRDGSVGQILVRGREPGLVMNGYRGMPEETSNMIIDGWVYTGDLGSLDEDDYLTFHGRLTDSIRRRGENISALEVEELIASHPSVLEASAIGVPSDLTEDEVSAFVVLRQGAELTAPALHKHCLAHGAAYMVPRYITFVRELPKTPTEKVEKRTLKSWAGSTAGWDSAGG